MGFEIYLRCLDDDAPHGLPRAAVRALFPIIDEESQHNRWTVRYDRENTCHISVTSHPSHDDFLSFISIERPCGDLRFWETILALLKMGRAVCYFPGGPPLVADQAVGAALPTEEVQSLGPPVLVKSAQDILRILQNS
jgi:hypothetical protein